MNYLNHLEQELQFLPKDTYTDKEIGIVKSFLGVYQQSPKLLGSVYDLLDGTVNYLQNCGVGQASVKLKDTEFGKSSPLFDVLGEELLFTIHNALKLITYTVRCWPLSPVTGEEKEWGPDGVNLRCSALERDAVTGNVTFKDYYRLAFPNDTATDWVAWCRDLVGVQFPFTVPNEPVIIYFTDDTLRNTVLGDPTVWLANETIARSMGLQPRLWLDETESVSLEMAESIIGYAKAARSSNPECHPVVCLEAALHPQNPEQPTIPEHYHPHLARALALLSPYENLAGDWGYIPVKRPTADGLGWELDGSYSVRWVTPVTKLDYVYLTQPTNGYCSIVTATINP